MKRILLTVAFVFGLVSAYAADQSGSIKVSVLTCSPGQEVYSLYGHTAIRVQDMYLDCIFLSTIAAAATEHY